MSENMTLGEDARKFLAEDGEYIERWENGSPSQQMLANAVKLAAGVE